MVYLVIVIVVIFLMITFKCLTTSLGYYKNKTLADVAKGLDSLFAVYGEGGSMTIQSMRPNRKEEYLQFAKRVYNDGCCIEFSFPEAEWSKQYFSGLVEELNKNEIAYEIESSDDEGINKYLKCKNIKQTSDGMQIIRIACKVLGLDADEDRFILHAKGPVDEELFLKYKQNRESELKRSANQ